MTAVLSTNSAKRELLGLIAESLNTEIGMLLLYEQETNKFPLRFAHNLDEKKLKEDTFNNIQPLENLNNLERLNLHNNQLDDLSPLKGLTKQGNRIKNRAP